MTWALAALCLLLALISEARVQRNRRADRLATLNTLARIVGIGPAVKLGQKLGWVGKGDVRSDGDHVSIRLKRWRPWRN